MTPVSKIQREIDELVESHEKAITIHEAKKIRNKIVELRVVKAYINSSPRRKFILSEKQRLEKKITCLNDRYADWVQTHVGVKRSVYEQKMGITIYRNQIRFWI